MSEIAGQVFAHEVIDDEHEDDPEQNRAHRAPRDFQRQQHEGRRDRPVGGRQGIDAGPAGDEFRPVQHHVGTRREADTGQQDAGDWRFPYGPFFRDESSPAGKIPAHGGR